MTSDGPAEVLFGFTWSGGAGDDEIVVAVLGGEEEEPQRSLPAVDPENRYTKDAFQEDVTTDSS